MPAIAISPEARPPILAVQVQGFIDYCEICDAQEFFVIGGLGFMARCLGCGDERIAPLTRTNSED